MEGHNTTLSEDQVYFFERQDVFVEGFFSAGFVLWTARAGYLTTLLSSSLPAWASIDPIPVLSAAALAKRKKRDGSLLNAETLVDIAEGQKS